MPMYFPDLKSVQRIAEQMTKHEGKKKYVGIIPKTDAELPKARKALGKYFREVWGDEIQAMEIEESVTENDYHEKLGKAINEKVSMSLFYEQK